MNTMEITKIVAGLCGSLLIFLLIGSGVDAIYASEGGHGEEHHNAYVIEVAGAEEHDAEPAEVVAVDMVAVMAAANIADGEKSFKACKGCHKAEDGANGVGPFLYGVVGRDIASADGFAFTEVMLGLEGDWDAEALNEFLTKPKDYAPGTKMTYPGMKKLEDRANLIAYLDSLDD